jgi:hypothetical protein
MTGEDQRGVYPGLLGTSVDLWRKWLQLYQGKFEAFYYNVRVGAGVRPPAGTTPEMARDWWAQTCLRIDAVGEREDQTWVIEIAERPSTKILGQLQLYSHITPLYQGQNAQRLDVISNRNATDFLLPTMIRPVIIPALVCRYLGSDFAATIVKAGIYTFQFPGTGPAVLPAQFMPQVMPTA